MSLIISNKKFYLWNFLMTPSNSFDDHLDVLYNASGLTKSMDDLNALYDEWIA
jgi:hypothetical protein